MKNFFGILFGLILIVNTTFAMNFSQPVEIGGIGFPVQSPYRYYLVEGATFNSGKPYEESPKFAKKKVTYKEGIAIFGNGNDALYCQYVYAVPPSNSDVWKYAIKFGGKNNYVVSTESQYKKIYRIDTNEGLTLYFMFRSSGSEHINIIGRQKDSKWVSYVDSDTLTDKFFGGKQSYKSSDGVHYNKLRVENDTIIIPYIYMAQYKTVAEGEFRFKWDESAQWFGIEQVIY